MPQLNLLLAIYLALDVIYLTLIVIIFWRRSFDRILNVYLLAFAGVGLISTSILTLTAAYQPGPLFAPTLLRSSLYAILLAGILFAPITNHFLHADPLKFIWWALAAVWVAGAVAINENLLNLPDFILITANAGMSRATLGLLIVLSGCALFLGRAVYELVGAYRHAVQPLHRNRLRYWYFALIPFITAVVLYAIQQALLGSVVAVITAAIITYTSLTLRLPDQRQFLRNSSQFIISSILAVIVYAVVLTAVPSLSRSRPETNPAATIGGVALIIALVINPLLNLIQRLAARLFARKDYDSTELLSSYSKNIANILELEQLSVVITGMIDKAMRVTHSALYLITPVGKLGYAILEIHPGTDQAATRPIGYLDANSPLTLTFSQDRLPVTQYDIDLSAKYKDMPRSERSWLSTQKLDVYVPIYLKDRWIGLLGLGPKISGDRFFLKELQTLETVADQTAIALENASLYEDLKHRNRENERLNARLSAANKELERLDEAKTDFISIASHELRTPLTRIIGYNDMMLEMLRGNSLSRDLGLQMTESVAKAARRLEEIADMMFDVSKVDTNSLELIKSPVSLSGVAAAALEKWGQAVETRNQKIVIEGLNNLPIILADGKRLGQALSHLIQNAIKSTPDGGEIRISGCWIDPPNRVGSQWIEIVVADTGIGIAAQDLERIFEKFYRVGNILLHSTDDTKFKGAGPGLGLTIARGIIEAHGGRLWAESPGHDEQTFPGAQFHILLPAEKVVMTAEPQMAQKRVNAA